MPFPKTKAASQFRWAILAFTCLIQISNYYNYDVPAALNSQIDEWMHKPSDYETLFSLLYTVYSVPNIILPFFGGYFIDSLGVRRCLMVFISCITVGAAVFAIGLGARSWPIMFLGRILFGLGGENLGVANSAILSVWFKGNELAFAFGLNLSISRLGSVFNNLTSPALTNSYNIEFALWFGVILCAGGFGAALVVCAIDRHVDAMLDGSGGQHALLSNVELTEEEEAKQDNDKAGMNKELRTGLLDAPLNIAKEAQRSGSFSGERAPSVSIAVTPPAKVQFKDVFSFKQVFWILALICVVVYGCVLPFNNIASALLLERNYFRAPPSDCQLTIPDQCQSTENPPNANCPTSHWYQPPLPTTVNEADIDCNEDSWSSGCTAVYCSRQSDAQVEAGTIMSIPYIISACLSPFLGGFVDRFGLRAVIATISPLLLLVVHICLGFTRADPVGPLVGQGLAYAGFASVLWPSIAMVIDERLVGFGYGIVVSIQNLGLATFPLMIAAIYTDASNLYIPQVEIFFIALAWMGVVIGLYLNYLDYYSLRSLLNRGLNTKRSKSNDARAKSDTFALINPSMFENDDEVLILGPVRDIEQEDEESYAEVARRTKSSELFATSMVH